MLLCLHRQDLIHHRKKENKYSKTSTKSTHLKVKQKPLHIGYIYNAVKRIGNYPVSRLKHSVQHLAEL